MSGTRFDLVVVATSQKRKHSITYPTIGDEGCLLRKKVYNNYVSFDLKKCFPRFSGVILSVGVHGNLRWVGVLRGGQRDSTAERHLKWTQRSHWSSYRAGSPLVLKRGILASRGERYIDKSHLNGALHASAAIFWEITLA